MNGDLPVAAVSHAGQPCHRFALAASGENAETVIPVPVDFFRFDEGAFRRREVAHFQGNIHYIHHGAAEDADFALVMDGGVHSHLDTGYVGCEGGQNDTALASP